MHASISAGADVVEDRGAMLVRPAGSKALAAMLAEFGTDGLERMHLSDKPERPA